MERWVVKFSAHSNTLGVDLILYVSKVISYRRRKWSATIDQDDAHKYANEANARRAAELVSGSVVFAGAGVTIKRM